MTTIAQCPLGELFDQVVHTLSATPQTDYC